MRESLKDLRDALHDEHTMHRAKSIACFRSFDPIEDKAFDKNPHLKSLRDANDSYEAKNAKVLDEFEGKCLKAALGDPSEIDDHADWASGRSRRTASCTRRPRPRSRAACARPPSARKRRPTRRPWTS